MRRQIVYIPRVELEGRCTGCRLCELTCSMSHSGAFNPDKARIRVVTFDGGLDIPTTCNQCGLCLDRCPVNLIKLNPKTGSITIDEEKCTGCGVCIEWCPIGAISLNPETSKAQKCDLCDGSPECVKYCPSKVLHMLDTSSSRSIDFKRRIYAATLASNEQLLRDYKYGDSAIQSLIKISSKVNIK
ncbi:4Fe-4S dicluster domain-containing protein [Candidatus Bathyarchaeota archaeon]|nr:4Fe-4S dicluster domain-containing protein [Candidatus Bathyarchaeota archaeon]